MAGLFDMLSGGSDPSQGGGLMAMLANPQAAGMLGMAGGLLQAAGPSRIPVSMGQALGAGFQGMGQGVGNAMQAQRQLLQMRAMQGLMGGSDMGSPAQSSQPNPTMAQGAPVSGPANIGPMSGLSAGLGGMAPQLPPQTDATSAPQAGATIYGHTPQQLFQQGMLMNMAGIPGGGDMMRVAVEHDPTLAAQMPTDITKMGVQGGMTADQIRAANAAGVAKANYIAPVNARPGAILRDPLTMQPMAFNPNIPAGGTPVFDASGNVVGINPIAGAANVTSQMAAAKTAGEGAALPFTEGKDANGNPLPVMSRTQAATGNLPAPLRNNNPGALMPNGQMAQYPDMQTGLAALDKNLQSYGKQGVNTLAGVISKWAPPNQNDTQAYIKDVSQRLGVNPNQPIDLANPAVRQAISTGIMLHENGPGAVFNSGAAAHPQGGTAIYAAAPLGATNAANASQTAPSQQMAEAHSALSSQDASYQQSRAALLKMLSIAQNGGIGDTMARMLPQDVATRLSNDAAEYQKAHANYVSLQGKALGSGGTDASRAMLDEAVPTFDKPQDAKISGLTDQLNQLDLSHLKRQTLTPTYQQGSEKAYTNLSAEFDNTITPQMMPKLMPIISAPASPARTQALQQAIQDPQMKAALDLMVRTGQLK